MSASLLIIEAIEKAGEEIGMEVSLSKKAQHLSEALMEDGIQLGDRSLRDKYQKAISGETESLRFKTEDADALSRYLDYTDYADFCYQKKEHQRSGKTRKWIRLYLVIIVVLLVSFGWYAWNKETANSCYMWWNTDHYEVAGEEELPPDTALTPCEDQLLKNFKKVEANCDTPIRTPQGNAALWYGKNPQGEYEWFTAYGTHPLTGKTLKEVTEYMRDKYLCGD